MGRVGKLVGRVYEAAPLMMISSRIPDRSFFDVQSDNHTRINNSAERKHMFDLTTLTNNSTLQAGLVVVKVQLIASSVIYGTMMNTVLICKQD